ncbi:hypothetical protein N9414_00610, partial [Nodularia spumigena CCY9414]
MVFVHLDHLHNQYGILVNADCKGA